MMLRCAKRLTLPALIGLLICTGPALASSGKETRQAQSRIELQLRAEALHGQLTGLTLGEALQAISNTVGVSFSAVSESLAQTPVSLRLEGTSLEAALARLLRGQSYFVRWIQSAAGPRAHVSILGPGAEPTAELIRPAATPTAPPTRPPAATVVAGVRSSDVDRRTTRPGQASPHVASMAEEFHEEIPDEFTDIAEVLLAEPDEGDLEILENAVVAGEIFQTRLAAIESLQASGDFSTGMAIDRAMHDPSSEVRFQALTHLEQHAGTDSGVDEAIAHIARRDEDPGLRNLAKLMQRDTRRDGRSSS